LGRKKILFMNQNLNQERREGGGKGGRMTTQKSTRLTRRRPLRVGVGWDEKKPSNMQSGERARGLGKWERSWRKGGARGRGR